MSHVQSTPSPQPLLVDRGEHGPVPEDIPNLWHRVFVMSEPTMEGGIMKEKKLGQGISVQGFDSLEELLDYQMRQESKNANQALPEQWAIGVGDYVFRLVDELPIFGHITQRSAGYDKGYRYGRFYSSVLPEGEYGSAHVATLWKISRNEFNRARRLHWEVWYSFAVKMTEEIMQATAHNQKEGNDHE